MSEATRRDQHRASPDEEAETLEELAVTAAASIAELVISGSQTVGLLSNGADAAERYPKDWSGDTFRRLEDVVQATASRRKITGFRPLEATPARGRWQLERLMQVLARLTPAPGLDLPSLLVSELPRLPRSLVLMIVTPRVDQALAAAVATLERSGIEVGVLWIGGGSDSTAPILPQTPVYAVRDEQDLEALGGQRL